MTTRNLAVCSKCNSKKIKVIRPTGKEGYWFICEKCNFEKQLPDNETTKRLHEVEMFYIGFLTACYVHHNDLEEIIESMSNYKLERFARIMEENR